MPLHIANAQRFMSIVASNAVNGIKAGKELAPSTVKEAAKRRELIAAFRTLAGFSGEAATVFTEAVRDMQGLVANPAHARFGVLDQVNDKMLQVIRSLEEVSLILNDKLIPQLQYVSNNNDVFTGKIDVERHEQDLIFAPWFWEEGLQHLNMVIHDLREFHYDQLLVELVQQTEDELNSVLAAMPVKLTDMPAELCRYANDNASTVH